MILLWYLAPISVYRIYIHDGINYQRLPSRPACGEFDDGLKGAQRRGRPLRSDASPSGIRRGVLDRLGVSGWRERSPCWPWTRGERSNQVAVEAEGSRLERWGRREKWKRAKEKKKEKKKNGCFGEGRGERRAGPTRTGPVYLVRHTLSDLWRPIRQRFSSWPHTRRGLPNENRLLSKYRGCVVRGGGGVPASLKPISGRPIFMHRGSIPSFSCIYRRGQGRERIAWVKEESCSSSQVLEMFDLRFGVDWEVKRGFWRRSENYFHGGCLSLR